MSSLTPTQNAHLKLMPVALIKKLRATTVLKVYNHMFNLDSMKLTAIKLLHTIDFMVILKKICVNKLNSYLKDKLNNLCCITKKYASSSTSILLIIVSMTILLTLVLKQKISDHYKYVLAKR